MQDAEIVTAVVAGDADGLAAAYDRHAPMLYGYCRSLLGEPAYADDAVLNTFIIAAARLHCLREPARLRPWLYAVARNECRRKRFRTWAAPVNVAAEVPVNVAAEVPVNVAAKATDDTVDLSEVAPRADRRALVGVALAGLKRGDREVIELNLRHELTGQDLADVLGVSENQAEALASQARSRFEASLGALLVARIGRGSCPELAALVPGGHGRLNALVRKRIDRHISQCATCRRRRHRELTLAIMLSLLPEALIPYGLRDQVLGLAGDPAPDASARRAAVIARAGQFSPSGFPWALGPPRAAYGPNTQSVAAGLAVAAIAAITVLLFGAFGASSPSPFPPAAAGGFAPALSPRGIPEVRSAPAAGGGGGSPAGPSTRIDPGAAGLAPKTPIAFFISPPGQTPTPAPSITPVPAPTPAPTPVSSSPTPAPSTPAPAPSTPTPAPSTPTPAPTTPSPDPTTPTPAPTTPAPGPTTPAPGPTTPAPGPTTAAPGPTTAAPAPTAT